MRAIHSVARVAVVLSVAFTAQVAVGYQPEELQPPRTGPSPSTALNLTPESVQSVWREEVRGIHPRYGIYPSRELTHGLPFEQFQAHVMNEAARLTDPRMSYNDRVRLMAHDSLNPDETNRIPGRRAAGFITWSTHPKESGHAAAISKLRQKQGPPVHYPMNIKEKMLIRYEDSTRPMFSTSKLRRSRSFAGHERPDDDLAAWEKAERSDIGRTGSVREGQDLYRTSPESPERLDDHVPRVINIRGPTLSEANQATPDAILERHLLRLRFGRPGGARP